MRRGLPQRSLIFGRPLQALERLAKWSSRRGSNPHSIGYSGAQSGHVYRGSHPAERYNSWSSHSVSSSFRSRRRKNLGRTDLIKPSLLNVVLPEPTTISYALPDPGTLLPRTFIAHCSFPFRFRIHLHLAQRPEDVFHFASRDVKVKNQVGEIANGINSLCATLSGLE